MKSLRRLTIGIVGAGNMGQALLKGLRTAGVLPGRLAVVEENPATRRDVLKRYRVRATGLARLAAWADVIIVAVKPQDIAPVLAALREALRMRHGSRPFVISIAAGVRIATIERILGRAAVVRVMPNLAAKVGCAMSAVAAGRWTTAGQRAVARQIFECVGRVVELPERLFDVVTAISGSGPAYFFLIFRALRDAGVRQGLPKALAQQLAVQTAVGAARLVDPSALAGGPCSGCRPTGRSGGLHGLGEDLDRLMTQVASKGGTTEAALKVFERRKLAAILQAGVASATERSKELSWSLSKS